MSSELADRIDRLVAEGGYRSRAALLTHAAELLLSADEHRRIDRAIVEGYRRTPPTTDEMAQARAAGRRSIMAERW